jgi:2OG-Fe(II) oxygenase superfamily
VRTYRRVRKALPEREFKALKGALLGSPLMGQSTLAGTFASSRGFAAILTAEGRPTIDRHFPALTPWLDRVLGAPAVRAMNPWWKRSLQRVPNAWYLNVLVLEEGGTVARHVDSTLRRPTGVDDAGPELVTVLYLNVPSETGGELVLWQGNTLLTRLAPHENQCVHFRGELAHEVCAFSARTGGARASLVIEQYHVAAEPLARLPAFRLESRAGFAAYLEHHSTRSDW